MIVKCEIFVAGLKKNRSTPGKVMSWIQ